MAYIKRKPPGGGDLPSGSLTLVDYNTNTTMAYVSVGENVATNVCSLNVTINATTDLVISSWQGYVKDADTDINLIVTTTLREYDGSTLSSLGEVTKGKQNIATTNRRWNHSFLVTSTGLSVGEHTIICSMAGFNSPANASSGGFSVLVLGVVP